jgi:CRISPR system Cascade subunit CasD
MPTRSAILGMASAALGIRRDDNSELQRLRQAIGVACCVDASGRLLTDFHTVQTATQASLKHAPAYTRRDELSFPSSELKTILSTREYHEDFRASVGLYSEDSALLNSLLSSFEQPRFNLYLGRKCCVLAWPLAPQIVDKPIWEDALQEYDQGREVASAKLRQKGPYSLASVLAKGRARRHAVESGLRSLLRLPEQWNLVTRRDDPVDRGTWQFANREWLERDERLGAE